MEVGGKISMGIKGWGGNVLLILMQKEKLPSIFLALPRISAMTPKTEYLSRYVAICTSQPTWKSGPQLALIKRLFLWLINSEVSPAGSKPQRRKDDTREKYVLIFPSCEVPVPLKLPESRRSPSLCVWILIEVAHNKAASLEVCYKLPGKNICTSIINLLLSVLKNVK